MGRPERLIGPEAGLVGDFASGLRLLREAAGRPGYRELARRARFSVTVLSEAAGGRALPTLPVAVAFVRACGGDVAEWERRWEQAAAALRASQQAERAASGRAGGRGRGELAASSELAALVIPRQLPAAVRDFTGRETEVATLARLLRSQRTHQRETLPIAVICGTPGVGKTALAVHLAHQVANRFPDGQLYLNLRGYDPDQPTPPAEALAGFLRVLNVAGEDIPTGLDERAARYRSLLAGRRLLVMLDNAASAAQVRPLLPGSAGCAVIVTSRDSLVGLVAREGAYRLNLEPLPLADAVRLLRALVGPRVDSDPHAAEALAARCSQLPLALRVAAELAAARPTVSLARLASELTGQQRLGLLDAGGDPYAGVRSVFSWSLRQLDPPTARAFRLMALHPGPDLDSYAAAALTGTNRPAAIRACDLLARTHLAQTAGPDRLSMHDLIRDYACELSAATDSPDERRAALTRSLDFYLCTAATAMNVLYGADPHLRPRIPQPQADPVPAMADQAAAQAWLDAEGANLAAAVAHAADHGWPEHATRLAATLFRHLQVTGQYPEIITICTYARQAALRTGDRAAEADALQGLTFVSLRHSRYREAATRLRQVLALYRDLGDSTGEARALGNLGITTFQLGRYADAIHYHRQALRRYRQLGDQPGEVRTLNNLSLIDLRQGRYMQAAAQLQKALDTTLADLPGARDFEACSLANLGIANLRLGDHQRAAVLLRQALALNREIGDPAGESYSLANLAAVVLRQGRARQAAGHLRRAVTLSREIGDQSGTAEALNGLGDALTASGQPRQARCQHDAALATALMIGDQYEQGRAHDGLARACHADEEAALAACHWEKALKLFASLGAPEADQIRTQLSALGSR